MAISFDKMNSSNNSILVDVHEWNFLLSKSLIFNDAILGLYILLGVTGNAVVIYIYGVQMKVRVDDRFFILVLGILDMIVCVLNTSFALWRTVAPVASEGNTICKVSWFVTRTFSTSSGLLILVIAFQRYLKICRPFGPQMTAGWKKIAFILIFIISVLIHIPLLIFYGEIKITYIGSSNITGRRCGLRYEESELLTNSENAYFYFMFTSAGVTLIGITALYTLSGKVIYTQMKKRVRRRRSLQTTFPQGQSTTSDTCKGNTTLNSSRKASVVHDKTVTALKERTKSQRRRQELWEKHKLSLMFMIIAAVCVLTYIPSLVANILVNVDSAEFWSNYSESKRCFVLFLFQIYILNHVVNPFIYGLFDRTFRKEVLKHFCARCL